MISLEFLITSLVVVLILGTGVLYTVATGLFIGKRASTFAALGCTLGIVPAMLASIFGLAAIFHTSAIAFQVIKYAGVAYLLYLAWMTWRSATPLSVGRSNTEKQHTGIILKGFLLNILNPKLSIFFLAFLPQFIPEATQTPLYSMFVLGFVFMLMTFAIFVVYGLLAGHFSELVIKSNKASIFIQKTFAAGFAGLGAKLAFSNQS